MYLFSNRGDSYCPDQGVIDKTIILILQGQLKKKNCERKLLGVAVVTTDV